MSMFTSSNQNQRQQRSKRRKKLIEENLLISLILSVVTILIVQTVSFFFIIFLNRNDLNRRSEITADEIAAIMIEPLYNIDNDQASRIAEALISSGRVVGMSVYSTAAGVIYVKKAQHTSRWIAPQTRRIEYRNIPLGDISIEYSDREFIETAKLFSYITAVLIFMVVTSNFIVFFFFLRIRVRRVFGLIESGIQEFQSGNYEYRIESTQYTDMDVIIDLLNDMSRNIQEKRTQLREINARLEERITKRTADLEIALEEQKRLQEKLVESGKLSVLGQLSAGIAHEFNTPLGAIISSNSILRDYIVKILPGLTDFDRDLSKEEKELYLYLLEIGFHENENLDLPIYTRQSKRDAARCLEEAGIDHHIEIADALAEMYLLDEVQTIIPYLRSERNLTIIHTAVETVVSRRMVEIIREAGKKASLVVSALQSYVALGSQAKQIVDVNEELKKILTLMHNMLKHGVEIVTDLSPVRILGIADKLDQVLLNLIKNAAQAMDYRGSNYIEN